VDTTPSKRNPLLPIFLGFLIAGLFNFQFYFVQHRLSGLGTAAVGSSAIFIVLFLVRSRFAWLGAIVGIVVLAAVMLLTYHAGYMGFSLTWPIAVVDFLLCVVLLGYLWKIRQAYLRYIAAKNLSMSRNSRQTDSESALPPSCITPGE
jgi:small-conductance mechanosensitive channel